MERRSDIRAAMQRLLTLEPPHEREQPVPAAPAPAAPVVEAAPAETAVPAPQFDMEWRGTPIEDIRRMLTDYGVWAESQEIAQALLMSLSTRPVLCYGLFASYMLGGAD